MALAAWEASFNSVNGLRSKGDVSIPMSNSASTIPLVDLVILMDTSPSMKDVANAVSDAVAAAITAAEANCPADLRVVWLGIEGRWRGTAFKRTLRTYLTKDCGVAEAKLRGRKRGELPSAGAQEDAARAIEDVSNHFDWREQAYRSLFYLGDEALEGGGGKTEAADIEAANLAIQSAQASHVRVHTYLGMSKSKHRDTIQPEYARVAAETQGQFFAAVDAPTNFAAVLEQIICGSQTPIYYKEINMSKKSSSQNSEDKASDAPPANETPTPEPPKSYVPTSMTGLQDYSYWWDYAREEAKKSGSKSKSFRRGRIWA